MGSIALFGAMFLLPLYLRFLCGMTAFEAGLFLLPLVVASDIVSPLAGWFTDRIGQRLPVVIGFLLVAFNTDQLSKLTIDTLANRPNAPHYLTWGLSPSTLAIPLPQSPPGREECNGALWVEACSSERRYTEPGVPSLTV